MDVGHADRQVNGGDAVPVEDIAVAAAAGGLQLRLEAQTLHRFDALFHRRGVRGELERRIAAVDRHIDAGAVFAGGLFEAFFHVAALFVEFFVEQAASLGDYFDLIGHDVGGHAAADRAKVGGGFLVDPQQGHLVDGAGRHLNGADALFRREAGMGGTAVNDGFDDIFRRTLHDDLADGAARIEDEGALGLDFAVIQTFGAVHADFFTDGENDLQQTVFHSPFPNPADGFDDGDDSRLVVAAENGRAVGADDIAVNDRLDAFAGKDCVHVAAEHQRFRRFGSRQGGDEVAGVAADFFAGIVELDLEAERLQFLFHVGGELGLLAGGAGDSGHLDKLVHEALRCQIFVHSIHFLCIFCGK